MEKIKFTKMQGLGNDFVIVDFEEYKKTRLTMEDFSKRICDRHFGVGADGLILPNLEPDNKNADIGWYFYNSDGTTAQMCGNGMRCFAKYSLDNKLVTKREFIVETLAGMIEPKINNDGSICVKMTKPILELEKIPFKGKNGQNLKILDREFSINAISMGNPHCVIFVDKNEDLLSLAKKYGPEIERHELFPEKTNVEFIKIKSQMEIDFMVYERGCGITLACGTGACAATVAAILNNLTENKVKVNLLGGALTIEWQGSTNNIEHNVFMTGPAKYTFFGEYVL